MSLSARLRQHFCRHAVYVEDIVLFDASSPDRHVKAACYRCGKVLSATCGLALDASLDSAPVVTASMRVDKRSNVL